MAQVVELFGAPGTGKSSLVRALDGRRVAGRTLIAAQRLTRVARAGRGTIGQRWAALPLDRLLRRDLTPGERRRVLSERREDWSALLELIADAPVGRDELDPLRGLHASGWLAASLELRALADEAPAGFVVLLDEGLIQRTPLVCGIDPDDAALDRYLARIPQVVLHVHLSANSGALIARLRGRDRVIDRHVGLGDGQLGASVAADSGLFQRVSERLATCGHEVLQLDTSEASLGALADEITGRLGVRLDRANE